MNPLAILMFCFSGALLLYAALLALTKDYKLIPRHHAVRMKNGRAYARKMAGVIALTAIAPLYSGIAAMLFNEAVAMVVLVVEFVLTIWLGAILMKE